MYYKIWVDCIKKASQKAANKNDWPIMTMMFMSIAMAMNINMIVLFLKKCIFRSNFYDIEIDVFPGEILDGFLSFFLLYFFPALIINYLLIFRKRKYLSLLNKHEGHNGRLFFSYFAISLLLPLILVFLLYFKQ